MRDPKARAIRLHSLQASLQQKMIYLRVHLQQPHRHHRCKIDDAFSRGKRTCRRNLQGEWRSIEAPGAKGLSQGFRIKRGENGQREMRPHISRLPIAIARLCQLHPQRADTRLCALVKQRHNTEWHGCLPTMTTSLNERPRELLTLAVLSAAVPACQDLLVSCHLLPICARTGH